MSELSDILQEEEVQSQAVEKVRAEIKSEIERKKQELALELSQAGLSQREEKEVFEYKNQEIKKIEKAADEDFQKKFAVLKQKEQTNFKAAVDCVLSSLVEEKSTN